MRQPRHATIHRIQQRGDEHRNRGMRETSADRGHDGVKTGEHGSGGEQVGQQVDAALTRRLAKQWISHVQPYAAFGNLDVRKCKPCDSAHFARSAESVNYAHGASCGTPATSARLWWPTTPSPSNDFRSESCAVRRCCCC